MAMNGVKSSVAGGGAAAPLGSNAVDGSGSEARVNKSRELAKAGAGDYAKAARRSDSDAAQVNISPRAREMAAAARAVRETPDVREDKVASLKQAIQNGTYKPDAGKIADGIAREAIRDELSATPEIALED